MTVVRTHAGPDPRAQHPAGAGRHPAAGGVVVRPVAGHIGAEVEGVDLTRELTDGQVDAVRAALLRWKVLFLRDQHVTPAQQVAFGRRFGSVRSAHPTFPSPHEHPEVLQQRAGDHADVGPDGRPAVENRWRTDGTFVADPPMGSILRAVEVPAHGGDTAWTNLAAAYRALSAPVQRLVTGLRAVHRDQLPIERGSLAGAALQARSTRAALGSVHPVVRIHPETGEKALFVNPTFTSHVVGLTNGESRRILGLLYEVIGDPRFTVRFRWAAGSVAFWDNRSTAHLDAFDLPVGGARQVMHRITLAGDVPVGTDGYRSETIGGTEGGALP